MGGGELGANGEGGSALRKLSGPAAPRDADLARDGVAPRLRPGVSRSLEGVVPATKPAGGTGSGARVGNFSAGSRDRCGVQLARCMGDAERSCSGVAGVAVSSKGVSSCSASKYTGGGGGVEGSASGGGGGGESSVRYLLPASAAAVQEAAAAALTGGTGPPGRYTGACFPTVLLSSGSTTGV